MRSILILLLYLITTKLDSQNINRHKWENRVAIVVSKTKESKTFKNQVEAFKTSSEEFIDRKLIVYYALPQQYKLVDYKKDTSNNKWIRSSELFEIYTDNQSDFKVILIGLDGSIKLEQYESITASELFETIDTMPMRKSEIRKQE